MPGRLRALALLAAFLAAADDDPRSWVWFDSRETGNGPVLAVETAKGEKRTLPATADTVLIAYINESNFARNPRLSVDLADTNRVLLAFDLAGLPKVRKAELVLRMGLPDLAPKKAFGVALFPLEAAWEEGGATWAAPPKAGRKPVARWKGEPRAGEVRIPVTEAVNAALADPAAFRGWLLRTDRPLPEKDEAGSMPPAPPPGGAAGGGTGAPPATRDLLPWAPSVDEARKRAGAEGRLVLAFVDGTHDPAQPSEGGALVEWILLCDPDVRALVASRFVPVALTYQPQSYTLGQPVPRDPLAALGTATKEVKAPALLVASAGGKTLAVLESIGTFDRGAAWRFLASACPPAPRGEKDPVRLLEMGDLEAARAAFAKAPGPASSLGLARADLLGGDPGKAAEALAPLAKAGDPAARGLLGLALLRSGREAEALPHLEAGARGPEAPRCLYWLGCLRWAAGEGREARECWEQIASAHGGSPWAVCARLRLASPERLAAFEALAAADPGPGARSTERPVPLEGLPGAVDRAVDWLLDRQDAGGAWPIGNPEQETIRPGVVALAARALVEWAPRLDAPRRERAGKAVARAVAWLDRSFLSGDPGTANSFDAAYVLALHLSRMAGDPGAKGDAQRAADLLVGGQCPGGAWSYDRRFGESWRGGFGGWPKTDRGRVHSMNTGLSLSVLARAKEAGIRVDPAALARGAGALLRMKTGPAAFTYTYPDPISFEKADLSLGRAPLCETALRALGKGGQGDLEKAVANFLEGRAVLRGPVKLTPGWTMPGGVSSYFYSFAYLHAAEAVEALGGPSRDGRLAVLRDDLLAVAEADGTWVDYPALGKAYGTAMALLVLAKAPGPR